MEWASTREGSQGRGLCPITLFLHLSLIPIPLSPLSSLEVGASPTCYKTFFSVCVLWMNTGEYLTEHTSTHPLSEPVVPRRGYLDWAWLCGLCNLPVPLASAPDPGGSKCVKVCACMVCVYIVYLHV